jgi:carbon-monoxide dehydrogenase small subunit
MSAANVPLDLTVNGRVVREEVEPRTSLADFLRERLGLHGTHLGCEQGACGACTVLLDRRAVRGCLVLAAQADGAAVLTIEALAGPDGELHPLQAAFRKHFGLQCGFCSPGFVMTTFWLLSRFRDLTEERVREAVSGNLCRCTGYEGIIDAILEADRTWQREIPANPPRAR